MVLWNESLDCLTEMGKASRWIRSLLGGKKEEKYKKKYASFSGENVAIVPVTPKEKQRWSFGQKSSRAFGSIVSTLLVNEGSPKQENEQSFCMAVTATAQTTTAETNGGSGKQRAVEHAAATKIQAVFRSYLVLIQTWIESHLLFQTSSFEYAHQHDFLGEKKPVC